MWRSRSRTRRRPQRSTAGHSAPQISEAVPLPEHGVVTVFVTLPNTKIEFIEPLGEGSPIAKFVERNADGGIHHVCYEVVDIIASRDQLIREGARVLGDGQPKIGAHGKPVLFFHPKDFSGALVEIEQSCRWPTASQPRLRSTS